MNDHLRWPLSAPSPRWLVALALCLTSLPASAEDGPPSPLVTPAPAPHIHAEPDAICPPRLDKVLAIGSSTMGSPLGKMLERTLTAKGFDTHRKATASSGLARPDFFDWGHHARGLITQHDPDIVVVQLGSNDFQPVRFAEREVDLRRRMGDRPHLTRKHPDWVTVYGERIDELLQVLGGDRERLIIWIGPYAYYGDNALEQGPVIDQLLRDRLSTWVAKGGHARYINAWADTFDARRGPLMRRRLPGRRGLVEIRSNDRIHLNVLGVEVLLRDPVVAELEACRALVSPIAATPNSDAPGP